MEPPEFDALSSQAQGDLMLFHYTTSGGLASILDSGVFRLSSMRSMNDPREALDFRQIGDGGPVLNTVLKDQVHLAAFTHEGNESAPEGLFARGFARARNWAQYGEAHRGAVLAFNRERLLKVAQAALPGLRHGRMKYRDTAAWDQGDIDWSWIPERNRGEDDHAYATRLLEQIWAQLYLIKNTDWQSEREFRLIYWGGVAPELPIVDCLDGIILGERFPLHEANVIGARLLRLHVPRLKITQLLWYDGAPYGQPASFPGLMIESDPGSPFYSPDSPYHRPSAEAYGG